MTTSIVAIMDDRPYLWIVLYISWSMTLRANCQLSQIFYMCPEMERDMVKCGDEFKIHQDDLATFPVNLIAASDEKQKRICRSGEIMSAAKCIEGAIDKADCSAMEFETGTSLKKIMKFNGTTSAVVRFCNSIGTKYHRQAVSCFGGAYRYMADCMTAYGPAMETEAKRKIANAVENQEILEISIYPTIYTNGVQRLPWKHVLKHVTMPWRSSD
ncbi:uncharacterized protein LOC135500741 isoform X3 [Lineus longissimus]|uniref:uncharacterized protein LOC135500741 isoform X3 n=1 Tax=Lineus longissimus TaxID=88925 RepID=UPI00315CD06E